MLHERLEAASREAQRRRQRIALIGGGVALLLVLFALGVIRIDLVTLGLLPPEQTETPPIPERTGVPPPEASPAAPPVARRALPAPTADAARPPSPAAASTDRAEPQPAADPAARERFKQSLAAYERDFAPALAASDFAAWDAALQAEAPERKEAAVAQFAAGDYAGAQTALDTLARDAETALAGRDRAFDLTLAAARDAADTDDYDRAVRAIDEALRLKSRDEDALALKTRIDALPPLLDLIRRAAIARTENDLEGEASLLEAALAMEPSRADLAERLDTVRGELTERRFAGHIERGLAAVERRDLAAARGALAEAKAMFAARPETGLLSNRVAGLARDVEIARLTRGAEAAAGADDWPAAQRHYAALAKLLPADAQVQSGLQLANTINRLSAGIDRQLAALDRLAAPNVASEARSLVDAARVPAALSPGLAEKAAALDEALAAWTAKIPVAVVSDGATHVSVRGVGQVGKTTGRTIELKPGRYTFEGARPGYRSKLVTIEVPPGAAGVTVEIVCDEPV